MPFPFYTNNSIFVGHIYVVDRQDHLVTNGQTTKFKCYSLSSNSRPESLFTKRHIESSLLFAKLCMFFKCYYVVFVFPDIFGIFIDSVLLMHTYIQTFRDRNSISNLFFYRPKVQKPCPAMQWMASTSMIWLTHVLSSSEKWKHHRASKTDTLHLPNLLMMFLSFMTSLKGTSLNMTIKSMDKG